MACNSRRWRNVHVESESLGIVVVITGISRQREMRRQKGVAFCVRSRGRPAAVYVQSRHVLAPSVPGPQDLERLAAVI